MNKKILLKYLLMYVTMFAGIVMYNLGIVNIFSTMFTFVGGYIAIKNTFDYRKVRRNMKILEGIDNISITKDRDIVIKEMSEDKKTDSIKPIKTENIIGLKRTRVYSRVRRRY